ncbi:SDR family oxidoreductase [Halieaceae bacterium IMCC14734]|uniref:SDR family oxidoreductase n=1 Tax=Candidatus Litorirhabdus singularis TaxID=2518993 RepID=A0ABT3TGT7_9GAMM|nr:SDR family oxidoreductase [Candidatus Litorirhabdus singularis]MCX2981537.1 SDR family oxidoreductase [Candidatus Litorirhabdus singularis]
MALLSGRVALVTGAGAGIGRGIARAYAREGATVVVAEYNQQSGLEVASQLAELGGAGRFIATDVSELATVTAAVEKTLADYGRLDILVNNAYPTMKHQPARVENIAAERLLESMTAGFHAVCTAMTAAFPAMRDAGYGRIINLCSLNGVNAHIGTVDYNAAKEAVRAYTRTAAREWAGLGITANIICPGAVTTPFKMLMEHNPEMAAALQDSSPMGYMGDPEEDIAPVAVFLGSDMSRYMTGNTLYVDGGGHINGVPWAPELPA